MCNSIASPFENIKSIPKPKHGYKVFFRDIYGILRPPFKNSVFKYTITNGYVEWLEHNYDAFCCFLNPRDALKLARQMNADYRLYQKNMDAADLPYNWNGQYDSHGKGTFVVRKVMVKDVKRIRYDSYSFWRKAIFLMVWKFKPVLGPNETI